MKPLLVVAWLVAWLVALLGAPARAEPCRAAKSGVADAQLEGARVVVCFDRLPRACWGFDFARLVWQPVPATARPAIEPAPRPATASSVIVTACAPDGSACHTVATPPATRLPVVTGGALVAVVEDERITIADSHTGRIHAAIAPWPHPENHRIWTFRDDVRFVGANCLVAELGDGDTTLAHMFTTHTGATVLDVPGGVDRLPPVALGPELVFASAGSTALVFIDPNRFARRSTPLFAVPAGLALLAATPTAIFAVQRDGDGTIAVSDGKDTQLVPGPPICR